MGKMYPWDLWFSLRMLVLSKGNDYDCSTASFMQQIRNAASRRGLNLKLGLDEDERVVTIEIVSGRMIACR